MISSLNIINICGFEKLKYYYIIRRKEMEQIRMEREKQDLSNIQKQLELSQIENEIEMKKSEMAIKRAEDLADSYLKAKNIKVTHHSKVNY